jgi:tripeptide aminopeptidase
MIPTATNPVASAQRRIATLAAATPVHRAFHWLHLHQPQLRQWLLHLVAIPAPPFAEGPRAGAVLEIFRSLGLSNPHLDDEGNALAELLSAIPSPDAPVLLVSAHLDTVFPSEISCTPTEDGSRILAPGACDNAAGLTALLGLAAALQFASITPPVTVLFCANTGEEGEGNLRGVRHLFTSGLFARRIAAAIVLDGAGDSAIVTRALGSQRFRLSVSGPGGHSWTDSGAPNPISLLSRILTTLADLPLPSDPRTTLNPGLISGGTSVNSIPSSATAQLDLRSTDPGTLSATADLLLRTAINVLAAANQANSSHRPATLEVERIGDRPTASLPQDSPLLHTIHAVDRHLGLRSEIRIGSTDANLPLSLGIPAVAVGTGGTGGGIHTLAEWYDPSGRETALRRILLTLLDTAHLLGESITQP